MHFFYCSTYVPVEIKITFVRRKLKRKQALLGSNLSAIDLLCYAVTVKKEMFFTDHLLSFYLLSFRHLSG